MITKVKTEHVYYCPTDEIAFTSSSGEKKCNLCNENLRSIGWFESDGAGSLSPRHSPAIPDPFARPGSET